MAWSSMATLPVFTGCGSLKMHSPGCWPAEEELTAREATITGTDEEHDNRETNCALWCWGRVAMVSWAMVG